MSIETENFKTFRAYCDNCKELITGLCFHIMAEDRRTITVAHNHLCKNCINNSEALNLIISKGSKEYDEKIERDKLRI